MTMPATTQFPAILPLLTHNTPATVQTATATPASEPSQLDKLRQSTTARAAELSGPPIVPHHELLNRALASARKVKDFRAVCGLPDGDKKSTHEAAGTAYQFISDVKAQGGEVGRYNQGFYLYNGGYWKEQEQESIMSRLARCAKAYGVKPFDTDSDEFQKKAYNRLEGTLRANHLFTDERRRDKVLINFLNCTLQIDKDGYRPRPHDAADFMRYQLSYAYDPGATCPLWQRYLDRVLPEKEAQMVLAEYLGWVFMPWGMNIKLEKVLLLYGDGHNGKSVVFDTVKALVGPENMANASLERLSTDLTARPAIDGKLINYASDISDKLSPEGLKTLASGEPIEARRLYGQQYDMCEYAKLMFNCNKLPRPENTDGFHRRWVILPFSVSILAEEKDESLADKIAASELPGIMNWVLEGQRRLLSQRRLTESAAVNKALADYRESTDTVGLWLGEDGGYTPDDKSRAKLSDMYLEYVDYCRRFQINHPLGKTRFGRELVRHKFMEVPNGDKAKMFFAIKRSTVSF